MTHRLREKWEKSWLIDRKKESFNYCFRYCFRYCFVFFCVLYCRSVSDSVSARWLVVVSSWRSSAPINPLGSATLRPRHLLPANRHDSSQNSKNTNTKTTKDLRDGPSREIRRLNTNQNCFFFLTISFFVYFFAVFNFVYFF